MRLNQIENSQLKEKGRFQLKMAREENAELSPHRHTKATATNGTISSEKS